MTIHIKTQGQGIDGTICETILRALPDWFGIEDAILQYVDFARQSPTILAYVDDTPIGFLSIKLHSAYTAEIYVMGVLPDYHRLGVGQTMVASAEDYLRKQDIEFLQVKTLSASHPDPNYARTRKFYQALGFREAEEFPTLWGESNPCLMLIKSL